MEDHGTRIIIYNLWEDDHGQLELDFDADAYVCLWSPCIWVFLLYHKILSWITHIISTLISLQDIQIRGVNRDEKNILMSKQFPNSKHFLTYRHSLRVSTPMLSFCLIKMINHSLVSINWCLQCTTPFVPNFFSTFSIHNTSKKYIVFWNV